jgi:predicted membrane metal-binding protein
LTLSGYHMAVVAGVVFFTVRALLACFRYSPRDFRSRNGRQPRR